MGQLSPIVAVLTPEVYREPAGRESFLLTLQGIEAIVSQSKDSSNGFTNRKEKKMQELYMQEKLGCRNGSVSTKGLQYKH